MPQVLNDATRVRQPHSVIAAALDAADADERAALAAHDVARDRLRECRSAYRVCALAAISRSVPLLPAHDREAREAISAAADKLARANKLYDDLTALAECDRAVIDAAAVVAQAECELDALREAHADRTGAVDGL